jgi:membrane protein YdbS with pleckstrin-like domain
MHFQAFLDSLPIAGVFLAFFIVALVAYEICFRIGRWRQEVTPDEKEGPTGVLVGSLLGLMAFLLAITTGMASDRFDARRGLVLTEANAIGTTFLRAGYLPEPAMTQSRRLLVEYVPLRTLDSNDLATLRVKLARSVEIHSALWSIAEELARKTPESDVLALYIESLNETIDVHETRLVAGVYGRVPETVVLLLFVGSVLTLGMVGYGAGLHRIRGPFTAAAMIAVVGAVITLVVDLDRPRDGFLKVDQQPLIDLQQQISPPGSG